MMTTRDIFDKVDFDPRSKEHLRLFQRFMETGKWNVCPFRLDESYETVPGMILDMIRTEYMKRVSA